MLVSIAQELRPSSSAFVSTLCSSNAYPTNPFLPLPMRSSLSFLRSLSLSLSYHHRRGYHLSSIFAPAFCSSPKSRKLISLRALSRSTSVEHLACEVSRPETEEVWNFSNNGDGEAAFDFDKNVGSLDLKRLEAPALDVKELGDLPEQWRRSKLAWLCKELPAHKGGTLVRILNAQRKWVRQEDATYVAVHCMRIRENETGFKVNFTCFCFPFWS